jgi:hypothetical protein
LILTSGCSFSNQSGNYNNHFDITAGLNSIVYDLEQGAYDIEVRANDDCPIKSKSMTLPFLAQDKTVNLFGILTIFELHYKNQFCLIFSLLHHFVYKLFFFEKFKKYHYYSPIVG